MTRLSPQTEQRLLTWSIWATLFFAVLGIVWGIVIHSSIVLFDGIYSLASVLMSWMGLVVSKKLLKPEDDKFQFGRAQLEPLVVAIKSLGITLMCAYALVGAVIDLLEGGNEVEAGWGMLYALLASVACLIGWLILNRNYRQGGSDILKAETNQWFMDMWLSAAVMLGFVFSYLVSLSPYSHLTPYMDPAMVVIVAIYFAKVPIQGLSDALKEVVLRAPNQRLQQQAREIIEQEIALPDNEIIIRQAKVGRSLIIDAGVLIDEQHEVRPVAEQDLVRERIEQRLRELGLEPWLTVWYSSNKKWL